MGSDAGADDPASDAAAGFGAIAVVPVPGPRVPLWQVPRNVSLLDDALMTEQMPLGLQDALSLRLGSVTLNDVQNNPLQPDLQYRGFTVSPLLGTPQGIAIYQNGVRINESFGDALQWDLVPVQAIREAQLIPGANPLYGLNALGGSLTLRMKDGFSHDGYRATGMAGSFSRYQLYGEAGHAWDEWALYGAVSAFGEEGFRDASRSSAHNLYVDLRQRDTRQEVSMGLTVAQSDLNGNGPTPIALLQQEGRSALYTYPDNTTNGLVMLSASLDRELGRRVSVQATGYVRHLQRDTFNGDEGEFELCDEGGASVLCDEDGEALLSERGAPIVTDTAFDGLYNTTDTVTTAFGGSAQLSVEEDLLARDNQLLLGATFDAGNVAFLQRAQTGYLTPDRSVLAADDFLLDDAYRTALTARNRYFGVYAADTWSVLPDLALQASARFNWARITLVDEGPSSALDGKHDFVRVNPSLGASYQPLDAFGVFASYGEASRAPSAAELACADPDEPCRLPNAFIADPPLDQVVSRSGELGARGEIREGEGPAALRWSVAGFFSRNFDDILFVAGSRVGTGYFRNAGQTQRAGLEVDLSGRLGPFDYFLSYTLQEATFQSRVALPGGANPGVASAGDGGDDGDDGDDDDDDGPAQSVEPGDRMPGIPTHSLKLGLTLAPTDRWAIGVNLAARSGSPYRGDEANLIADLPGFAVLGVHASYALLDQLTAFLKVQNLLDAEYETFGILAEAEVLPDTENPRFVSPGPPLAIFAGLTLHD